MKTTPITLVMLCLLMMGFIQQVYAGEFHPIAFIAYDDGGDVLMEPELVSVNGRSVSIKSKVKAGGGVTLAMGAYIPISDSFGIQGSVGSKTDSVSYTNGYVGFTRTPVDLLLYVHIDDHHSLAFGSTYHTNSKFTFEAYDSPSSSFLVEFDDAAGALVEYNYAVLKSNEGGLKVGFRYTNIQYHRTDGLQSFDGSSLGVILYAY